MTVTGSDLSSAFSGDLVEPLSERGISESVGEAKSTYKRRQRWRNLLSPLCAGGKQAREGCGLERLKKAELFLLDMDGTLYLGDSILPGAMEFIRSLEQTGKRWIYLTNNSSRGGADYVPRLRQMGFPCAEDQVYTSGMATAVWLKNQYPNRAVFPVGTVRFMMELADYGIDFTEEDPAAVVVGFDRELTYAKLEKAVHYLRRGADLVAANPDLVCPMPNDEVLPDCGSICALLTAATGKDPLYIGKPDRRMVDAISELTGVPNERIVCVGDRLYTDVAVGVNAGAVSVLVLSGETTEDMLRRSEIQPDYVFPSVKEIGEQLKET